MNRLILLLAVFVVSNVNALTSTIPDEVKRSAYTTIEQLNLEAILFEEQNETSEIFNVEDINVIEVEEEVDLGFDPKQYLPKGFNALEGKDDIDWSTVELIELEEEISLGFDTQEYLPKGFNPYKGMGCEKDVVVCLY